MGPWGWTVVCGAVSEETMSYLWGESYLIARVYVGDEAPGSLSDPQLGADVVHWGQQRMWAAG